MTLLTPQQFKALRPEGEFIRYLNYVARKGGGKTQQAAIRALQSRTNYINNPVEAIVYAAQKRKLDPAAMLAVAMQESGLNPLAKGDGGKSHGLFQFYFGGGYGSDLSRRYGQATALRMAKDPLSAALLAAAGMAPYAKGKKGLAAMQGMVRGFERPAVDYSSTAFDAYYRKAQRMVRQVLNNNYYQLPNNWWADRYF